MNFLCWGFKKFSFSRWFCKNVFHFDKILCFWPKLIDLSDLNAHHRCCMWRHATIAQIGNRIELDPRNFIKTRIFCQNLLLSPKMKIFWSHNRKKMHLGAQIRGFLTQFCLKFMLLRPMPTCKFYASHSDRINWWIWVKKMWTNIACMWVHPTIA